MKKHIVSLLALTGLWVHSGCITSLQPLVTAENIIAEQQVAGTWQYKGNSITVQKMTESAIFKDLNKVTVSGVDNSPLTPLQGKEKEDSVFYSKAWCVSYTKNGVDYYMAAAITRINNSLYMELMPVVVNDPEQPNGSGYEFSNDYLPTLTIAKLIINSNQSISLKFLNGSYIKEQVAANRIKIKHEADNTFGSFLVTASTRDLVRFMEKYGNDERLYSDENSLTLTKKG